MDFLPRGEGVVTRRPLELRLVHVHSSAGNDKPWGVFENNKNEKIYDFDKIRDKIVDLTEKDAGKNKGIIHTPILLTVYSPYCPDLTLIDLPGITRIPLSGSD
jgi:replication fork clamp-binding protein CrfC